MLELLGEEFVEAGWLVVARAACKGKNPSRTEAFATITM